MLNREKKCKYKKMKWVEFMSADPKGIYSST